MSALKGPKAVALAQRVAELLEPQYPSGLASLGIKAMPGGGVSVWPIMVGDDAALAGSPVRRTPAQDGLSEVDVVGASAVFGFGTWIPLLPRSVRARMNAQNVTETLLEQVVAAADEPSPLAGAIVRTRITGDEVRVAVTTPAHPSPVLSFGVPLEDCV